MFTCLNLFLLQLTELQDCSVLFLNQFVAESYNLFKEGMEFVIF